MAIDPTSSAATSAANAQTADLSGALGAATQANQGLGQDAFMKLLVAQISHQDPLKPMDDTAFVSQLAQFSALEQSMGTNTRLDNLAKQQQGIANTDVASLVGKSVTVKGSTVALDGTGFAQPVNFTLGGNANQVTVSIQDAAGKTVRTMQVGAHQAGLVKFSWDGKDDNGLTQPAGAYTVAVSAKDAAGSPVDASQQTTGVLTSVNYSNGYAQLVLDNGVSAPASDLISVNAATK
jgi:flagellar basal-body rod modification protein FlgD